MSRWCVQPLAVGLAWLLAAGLLPAQTAPRKLNIVIVEGEGAINNIRQRTAREPIVQVEDENRRPVAGAVVTFLLPQDGAGVVAADGSRTITTTTGPDGRAALRGVRPNNTAGNYQIRVSASHEGATGNAVINGTNIAGAAAVSSKLIALLAIAGGAAAGGIIAATRSNGNGGSVQPPQPIVQPIVLTPGTPSVTGPR